MRLLFVGSVYHQHIYNFSKALKELGQVIFAFDLSGIIPESKGEPPFVKVWSKSSCPKFKIFDFFCKFFGTCYRFLSIKEKFDVVQFHYMDQYYTLPLVLLSKLKGLKVSCFVYGSDFLQADSKKKKYLKLIFNKADCIVCDSVVLNNQLVSFSPHNREKFHVLNFGSLVIDDLYKRVGISNLNYSGPQKVVMCGYNGSNAQNHIKILEAISPYKDRIHLIIPMTYGGEDTYINEVRDCLERNGFEYELPTRFIPNEEWETMLVKTDIFIHMQDSDSFSSALAEHLFLGNVVINAEWLKYEELTDKGIYYISTTFEGLNNAFGRVLEDFDSAVLSHRDNKEKMYELKSLTYCCKNGWIPYFQTICEQR